MVLCKECKFWHFEYKKITADGTEFVVGQCRINPPRGNYFPEMFDCESCGHFDDGKTMAAPNQAVVTNTARKALEFIETTSRPPARATSATWDEYIDTIKKILKGEE